MLIFSNICLNLTEQLLNCISSAQELIKIRLSEPHKLPQDKKMIELIDEIIKQKLSMHFINNCLVHFEYLKGHFKISNTEIFIIFNKKSLLRNKGGRKYGQLCSFAFIDN
jgi:hypothetical protein